MIIRGLTVLFTIKYNAMILVVIISKVLYAKVLENRKNMQ